MTDNLKKIIMVLIILVILVGIILVALIYINKNTSTDLNNMLSEIEMPSDVYQEELNKIKIVTVRNEFFLVQDCIKTFYNNYLSYFNSGNNVEKVYDLLDKEYIETFKVTKDNIKGKFGDYKQINIDITNMYSITVENNKTIYFAYGYIIDSKTSKVNELAVEIKIDNTNHTFSVLPYEYLQQKNYLHVNEKSTLELSMESIENKTYNVCKTSYKNEEAYVTELFETYINRNLYNIDFAYKNLDSEYARKKFENIENYKKFVTQNRDLYLSYDMKNTKTVEDFNTIQEYTLYLSTFQALKLQSYKKTIENGYTQYVCIDSLDNYYIFRETAPMQYTVILDTYTVDLPEFTAQYEKASEQEKVLMNIQKFFSAIDDGDYKYAYNKLDATFRNNNFKTQTDFENYVKKNFFIKNTLAAGKAEKQSDIYIYNVTISDGAGKTSKTVTKSFVMQLKEGTDFVMSFSVE